MGLEVAQKRISRFPFPNSAPQISIRAHNSRGAWGYICLWTSTRKRRRKEPPAGRCLAASRTQQSRFTKSGSQQAGCRILGISQPTARTSCIQLELVSLQAKMGENVSQLSFFHLHHISSKAKHDPSRALREVSLQQSRTLNVKTLQKTELLRGCPKPTLWILTVCAYWI